MHEEYLLKGCIDSKECKQLDNNYDREKNYRKKFYIKAAILKVNMYATKCNKFDTKNGLYGFQNVIAVSFAHVQSSMTFHL